MKQWKRALGLLLVCTLLSPNAYALDVSARAAILYESSTGKILYQKNITQARPIASTTKIMTALLVVENADPNAVVTIKPAFTDIEGTSLYLKPGERLTVKTLLYGMMLQSGNDAALVLADYVGGNMETFVSMMNTRAQSLGMEQTHFENPNGLPAEGHVSSALDMAKLSACAMQNPLFREVVSAKSYTGDGHTFRNHNRLLKMREEIDGVKTGFTKAAGRCLVSSSSREAMRLVAVTLFDPNDWDDHLALYDFGFASYDKKDYCQKGEALAALPVAGQSRRVALLAVDRLSLVDQKNLLSGVTREIHAPSFCYAPVKKGAVLGEVLLKRENTVIARLDLIAAESIEAPKKKGIFSRYLGWLWGA